jgi:hypothetical protein
LCHNWEKYDWSKRSLPCLKLGLPPKFWYGSDGSQVVEATKWDLRSDHWMSINSFHFARTLSFRLILNIMYFFLSNKIFFGINMISRNGYFAVGSKTETNRTVLCCCKGPRFCFCCDSCPFYIFASSTSANKLKVSVEDETKFHMRNLFELFILEMKMLNVILNLM